MDSDLISPAARHALPHGYNTAEPAERWPAPDVHETRQVNAAYLNLIRMWSAP